MDIERLRQAVIDKRFILSANPNWRDGRTCGLTDDKTEQKANDALTIILENIAELVVAYLIDARQSAEDKNVPTSEEVAEAIELFDGAIKYRKDQEEEVKKHYGGKLPDFYLDLNRKEALAITALQAYRPKPDCESAERCGDKCCGYGKSENDYEQGGEAVHENHK